MGKSGKRHREMKKNVPSDVVDFREAITFLKENAGAGFDETMEMGMRMGIDPKKSEHAVRGTVSLPHGSGRNVRILVFATGLAADAAREAGADHVGSDDMIEKVKEGWTDFDVAIATPEAMKEVRKLGRVLGPRGLMPNPKTGTVTDDTGAAVTQSKAGKVEFRMDRHANINVAFGKASFEVDALFENAVAVVSAVKAEKPASAKGVYMRNCTLSSTMGAGIAVRVPEDQ